ncbi:MAG: hypothetical protein ACXW3C_06965 [Pyrinomonadaceae bacterium]
MASGAAKLNGKVASGLIIAVVLTVTLLFLRNWHSHMSVAAARMDAGEVDERLFVENGRPLAEAILMLEKRFRTVITYEDPPYVYRGDIADVTESTRRDLDKYPPGKAPRVFVPKGGRLEFVIVQRPDGPPDARGTLEKLVSEYASTIPAARFRIEKTANAFHAIPLSVRNAAGRLSSQTAVLDAAITLPAKERNGVQAIRDFCAEVSRMTHRQVVEGTIPTNLANYQHTYSFQRATNARIVLTQILKSFEGAPPLSWRLLYDPGMKMFVLNIHSVS